MMQRERVRNNLPYESGETHTCVPRCCKTDSTPQSTTRSERASENIFENYILRHERIPLTAAGYPEYVLRIGNNEDIILHTYTKQKLISTSIYVRKETTKLSAGKT